MSPAERLSVLLFLAGFFGGLGALSLMLSFGTDYWLLALETCGPGGASETWEAGALRPGEMEDQDTVTFFHQGFFWRCSFSGRREENMMWQFWISLCLLVVIMMYVVWTQVLDTLEDYAAQQQHSSQCPTVYHLSIQYGLSFLFAPVSVFFSLLAALLFILIGRTVRRCHHKVPM
ncbi:transmembrane protein 182-like isoform X2 [Oncorhynchus clarkii lewisi]|uniref:transmembrane protein 182-like isoform X2 n=1 Tax=Oncorhynchus clarkii lewisi TaxID=490388 RepID=UPI0039B994A0